jgi:transposase
MSFGVSREGAGCKSDFVHGVRAISSIRSTSALARSMGYAVVSHRRHGHRGTLLLTWIVAVRNSSDTMPRRKGSPEDPKSAALRSAGALHPHPEAIQDENFLRDGFFDRRDRVRVRYEMVRRHRVESRPVTEVASAFGVSRQAFYATESAFEAGGLPGLLPRPRGPRRAHKCTEEILDFAAGWRTDHAEEPSAQLAAAVADRFGVSIHPRSLVRALGRREKKRSREPRRP